MDGRKWDGGAGVQRFLQTYSASAKEKWDWAAAAQVQSSYSLLCVVDPWHFLLIPPTHGAVFFQNFIELHTYWIHLVLLMNKIYLFYLNLIAKKIESRKDFKRLAWIWFHRLHLQWKFKLWAGKFAWGVKAKCCWLLPIIWIFSECEGDGIESRLSS